MANALSKPWWNRELNRGLCGERDRYGNKASSRCRDSDYAIAERYDYSWKRGGDNQTARNNVWRDVECYQWQSEWSCKFWWWAGWGRRGIWWRRFWALQAEWWWWTWMGDGHNLRNSTAQQGEFLAEADDAWQIDTTGLGGSSWITSVGEIWNMRWPNWRFRWLSSPK